MLSTLKNKSSIPAKIHKIFDDNQENPDEAPRIENIIDFNCVDRYGVSLVGGRMTSSTNRFKDRFCMANTGTCAVIETHLYWGQKDVWYHRLYLPENDGWTLGSIHFVKKDSLILTAEVQWEAL